MRPSRRSVFGAILGAPVAASAGVGREIGALSAGSSAQGVEAFGYANSIGGPMDHLAFVKKQLADLAKRPSERDLAQARRNVSRFDPDLAQNRSMSVATKIRIQAERDIEFGKSDQRYWLTRQIAQAMGQEP